MDIIFELFSSHLWRPVGSKGGGIDEEGLRTFVMVPCGCNNVPAFHSSPQPIKVNQFDLELLLALKPKFVPTEGCGKFVVTFKDGKRVRCSCLIVTTIGKALMLSWEEEREVVWISCRTIRSIETSPRILEGVETLYRLFQLKK